MWDVSSHHNLSEPKSSVSSCHRIKSRVRESMNRSSISAPRWLKIMETALLAFQTTGMPWNLACQLKISRTNWRGVLWHPGQFLMGKNYGKGQLFVAIFCLIDFACDFDQYDVSIMDQNYDTPAAEWIQDYGVVDRVKIESFLFLSQTSLFLSQQ